MLEECKGSRGRIEMRMDKFLVECGIGSRTQVKELLKQRRVTVNGLVMLSPKESIKEGKDEVKVDGKPVLYQEFRYYILHKKAGYITATEDPKEKTVMELLPDWVNRKDLAPVGRLDKDTEGLLLFTNDGKLNHRLLSPKSHVRKTYYVKLEKKISEQEIESLEQGVDIGGYVTLPAKVESLSEDEIELSIQEGKFHQVKKMLEAVENKVLYLKRISFGNLLLGDMELGEVREISREEIEGQQR